MIRIEPNVEASEFVEFATNPFDTVDRLRYEFVNEETDRLCVCDGEFGSGVRGSIEKNMLCWASAKWIP